MAACFSNMPGSRPSAPGQLAADRLSQPPEDQDSLAAGKNAGNFLNSAVFCENLSRKHLRIQSFAYEFPTHTGQGIFLPAQGINSARRESQGIRRKTDPLAPTLPIAPKFFQAVDKNITNSRIRYRRGRTRLASPDRPRLDARIEPRSKSADVHNETDAALISGRRLRRQRGINASSPRADRFKAIPCSGLIRR